MKIPEKKEKGRKETERMEIIEENIHKLKKGMNLQLAKTHVSSKINKGTKQNPIKTPRHSLDDITAL